ncbi:DsbA family protein [Actinotalea fermentans]|uniref:Thioredoxin domain-containing protein n=1 Tax=Actinotalea fermentans TaxID=43671 RepID=A0A511Z2L2_9CELL|nr:thioredoxin domain-containing protein [Actinotalea fermentans]GEN81674.1 hypothetical protein AFE02nite_34080 [Actinotalea fermentans]
MSSAPPPPPAVPGGPTPPGSSAARSQAAQPQLGAQQTWVRPAAPRPPDRRRVVILTALGLVLALLVALVLLLPDGDGSPSAAPSAPSEGAAPSAEPTEPTDAAPAPDDLSPEELQVQRDALFAELVRRDPTDPTAIGAVDAPVVMIMWADFRCGYCAQFALETAPGLAEYVADGRLRIEWRDFPRVTQQSPAIAAAARAAGLQGRFWEFHDRVFIDQGSVEVMGDDYLRAVAGDLGLDVARFDADRASAEVLAAVDADAQQGVAIGVSGTPAFIVNGSPIAGSQPLETFVAVIETELARATT